jgi:hypothetical protein
MIRHREEREKKRRREEIGRYLNDANYYVPSGLRVRKEALSFKQKAKQQLLLPHRPTSLPNILN